MRVLETRTTPEGYKRRRYESTSKARHTTIEIPMSVWLYINRQGRGNDRAAAAQRRLERDSQAAQARGLHEKGWSLRAVARHLSVSDSTVRRWVSVKKISES